jgi:hypothetical protein
VASVTFVTPVAPRLNLPREQASETGPLAVDQTSGGVRLAVPQTVTFSSISVTSAAIGERSDRVRVTWANSG